MRPQVSVSCCFDYTVPIERQLPLIAAAGFTHLSLSRPAHGRYLTSAGRETLAAQLADAGLGIDSIHGPKLDADDAVDTAIATMTAAAELGAATVVIHPTPFDFPADELDRYRALLRPKLAKLADVARTTGVTVALENLCPGPATHLLVELLAELDPALFGLCYDSAHDQIDGPRPLTLLDEYAARVVAVHLSDRKAPFVDHLVPGEGFIDFEAICARLALAGFSGPILLEIMSKHTHEKRPRELLDLAYQAGTRLHALVHAESHEP